MEIPENRSSVKTVRRRGSTLERVGATRVFIGVIAAQLVVSMLWDFYAEGLKISGWRIAGGALALAGSALAAL